MLESLADESSIAAIKLLAELCRSEPELRDWLWTGFARDSAVRSRFERLIENPSAQVAPVDGFAWLNGEAEAWQREQRRLRDSDEHESAIFGGLTWNELEQVFRHYEAGAIDLGIFLLAHDWKEANRTGRIAPELVRASVAFLLSTTTGKTQLLRQFSRALELVDRFESPRDRRAAVGYTDWWKLQALRYIVRHPRPAYRTRDVCAYLASIGLEVGSLDFRRFCNRHGIQRDTQPGRPRKRRDRDGETSASVRRCSS